MYRSANILRIGVAVIVLLSVAGALSADSHEQHAKPVLFLLGEGFNGDEFWPPYFALQADGYDVVIAAPQAGNVKSPYDDRTLDVTADISLADVEPDDYLALVIPGGYGPAHLEKHDEALEICRAFFDADKPVATICHGPRLLMRADLLNDRVHTGLWKIKDELPDEWTTGRLGAYVDQAVVVDGNLITSRYPWDNVPLTRRTRRKLAAAVGRELDRRSPRIAVVDARMNRLDRWTFLAALPAAGAQIEHLPLWKVQRFMEAEDYSPADFRLLVVVSGDENEKLAGDENVRKLMDDFASTGVKTAVLGEAYEQLTQAAVLGPDVLRPTGSRGEVLGELLSQARENMPQPTPAPTRPATAAILLDDGFDGRVFAAMKAHLEYKGRDVLVVGPRTGWMRGLNGTPAEVHANFDQAVVADDAVIVAPGGLWPKEMSNTDARIDWLLERYDAGATIVAFGFDSLYIGQRERFKGAGFATSAQARWSFGGAGKYSDAPAVATAERLISAQGFEQVSEAMNLLEEQQPQ